MSRGYLQSKEGSPIEGRDTTEIRGMHHSQTRIGKCGITPRIISECTEPDEHHHAIRGLHRLLGSSCVDPGPEGVAE